MAGLLLLSVAVVRITAVTSITASVVTTVVATAAAAAAVRPASLTLITTAIRIAALATVAAAAATVPSAIPAAAAAAASRRRLPLLRGAVALQSGGRPAQSPGQSRALVHMRRCPGNFEHNLSQSGFRSVASFAARTVTAVVAGCA